MSLAPLPTADGTHTGLRFAQDLFVYPAVIVFVLALLLLVGLGAVGTWGFFARAKSERTFGDPKLVHRLVTWDASDRRAVKGIILFLALACGLGALSRPQYGTGVRLVPATNVDVVVVLDFSKSMYARDIVPNRIVRAKAEVAQLIRELPGARFGAVAFAGEPMSFPLTSDGGAIAQFFRGLEPNDMPVGGTATGLALERARELLQRDTTTKDHVRHILLVTDGEDLEGNPVSVAEKCASEGTVIDVVQIGGRAPEIIPEISADGRVIGIRRGDDGKPLTTELSAEGEAQLAKLAETTGGMVVRSQNGETGIREVSAHLSKMMREELSERVETVYAEVFWIPLLACVLLLLVEALLLETPRRRRPRPDELQDEEVARA